MKHLALFVLSVALFANVSRGQELLGVYDLQGTSSTGVAYGGRARVEREGAGLVLRTRTAGRPERTLRATSGPSAAGRVIFRGRDGSGGGISGALGGAAPSGGAEVVLDLTREAGGAWRGALRVGSAAAGSERLAPLGSDLSARLLEEGSTRFTPHRRGGAGVDLRVFVSPVGALVDVALRVVDRTGAVAFTKTLRAVSDDGLGVAWRWDGALSAPAVGYADPRRGPFRVTATVRKDGREAASTALAVTPVPCIDAGWVVSRVRPQDELTSRSKIVAFDDQPLLTGVVRAIVGGARVDQSGRTDRAYFVVVDGVARATIDGLGQVAVARWDAAAWSELTLEWQTIHALGLHSPAYKATQDATRMTRDGEFTNVVSNGPDEGRWLGRDTLEYRHADAGRGPSPRVHQTAGTVRYRFDADYADAALALGAARPGSFGRRDSTPTTATVVKSGLLDGTDPDLAGASARVHRISRKGDQDHPLLAMLEAYRGVPWLYGSLPNQVKEFVGYDCADLVFAAARYAGLTKRTEFTNANNMCKVYTAPRGAAKVYAFEPNGATIDARTRAPAPIRCGEGSDAEPRPGDVVFFDWDADGDWDHTTVLWSTGDTLDMQTRFAWAHHEPGSVDGFHVGTLAQLVGASPRDTYRMTIRRFP